MFDLRSKLIPAPRPVLRGADAVRQAWILEATTELSLTASRIPSLMRPVNFRRQLAENATEAENTLPPVSKVSVLLRMARTAKMGGFIDAAQECIDKARSALADVREPDIRASLQLQLGQTAQAVALLSGR